MNLDQAVALIKGHTERMNSLYGSVVFDEWAVVSFSNKQGRILRYSGSRKDDFQKKLRGRRGSVVIGVAGNRTSNRRFRICTPRQRDALRCFHGFGR